MSNLRLGLPSKGRLAEEAEQLVREAGLNFRRQERSLFAPVGTLPVDVVFLRTEDIPLLCAEGAIDMGVTGSDLVDEVGVTLNARLALGFGKCRLSVCAPQDSIYQTAVDLKGCRLATSFPNVTARFFEQTGTNVHLVPVSGSVEIMIALGVANAIVDLVQTGSTLAANHLRMLSDIGHYESVLVQNPATEQTGTADRVVKRLEGVVIARSWSLLEYNVPRERLPEAEAITPGYNSPTVSALEDPKWCAVQVMVRRDESNEVMDRLERMGATAILETRIHNCRL